MLKEYIDQYETINNKHSYRNSEQLKKRKI